jgi:hypothetical protein
VSSKRSTVPDETGTFRPLPLPSLIERLEHLEQLERLEQTALLNILNGAERLNGLNDLNRPRFLNNFLPLPRL